MDKKARSLSEVRLDALIQAATARALERAAIEAAAVDGFDAIDGPTSLRLTRRVVVFYEAFANELGISRNAAINLVLEQMVNTASSN